MCDALDFRVPLACELVHHPRSFAYETIKDRLPLIVTRIVDFLARHRGNVAKDHGDVSDRTVLWCRSKGSVGVFSGNRPRMEILHCCDG